MKTLNNSALSLICLVSLVSGCSRDNGELDKLRAENAELRRVELEKMRATETQKLAHEAQKETDKSQQWEMQIGRVLLNIERIISEKNSGVSFTATTEEKIRHLYNEEARMTGIARDQESQALAIIIELKSQHYPYAIQLEDLVKMFISEYISYLSANCANLEWIYRTSQTSQEKQLRSLEHINAYTRVRDQIRHLMTRR